MTDLILCYINQNNYKYYKLYLKSLYFREEVEKI
jgi:hypothetical protein